MYYHFFLHHFFVIAKNVVCIISHAKPLFSALSAFSLPGIPVWSGVKLIVGLYTHLMALAVVFNSSFQFLKAYYSCQGARMYGNPVCLSHASSNAMRLAALIYSSDMRIGVT